MDTFDLRVLVVLVVLVVLQSSIHPQESTEPHIVQTPFHVRPATPTVAPHQPGEPCRAPPAIGIGPRSGPRGVSSLDAPKPPRGGPGGCQVRGGEGRILGGKGWLRTLDKSSLFLVCICLIFGMMEDLVVLVKESDVVKWLLSGW